VKKATRERGITGNCGCYTDYLLYKKAAILLRLKDNNGKEIEDDDDDE
jgi:hypothetical protein